MMVLGCNSHPSKYKRKGCDCPKWSMQEAPKEPGQHAIFGVAPARWTAPDGAAAWNG
jgi:predicted transcriptional regulator